jgi:hypothetical protein
MSSSREERDEGASRQVSWALAGVGGWAGLHSMVWLIMREVWPDMAASFAGAEGMLLISVLFVMLGIWSARYG